MLGTKQIHWLEKLGATLNQMNKPKHTKKTVLLVEDDAHTRHWLTQSINSHTELEVIASCANRETGLLALSLHKPDVLVTDLGLPDGSGIDIIHSARKNNANIEIMVITVFGDERHVLAAIEAGASSYLLKDGDTDYIGKAILQLLAGESPISAAIARQLLKRYHTKLPNDSNQAAVEPEDKSEGKPKTQLTNRETEVLRCMAKGYTYNEAAEILGMSSHTVASHIKKIYRKLEVNSRSEAVYEAVQLGLVDIQS